MSSPERRQPRPEDGERPLDPAAADAAGPPAAGPVPPDDVTAAAAGPARPAGFDPKAETPGFGDGAASPLAAQVDGEVKDHFAPPAEPCECHCLHCGRTFMSTEIWFQKVINDPRGHMDGFWMCPTPNCSGYGFTFDIFPTDPDHPANEGWHDDDEDDAEAAAFNDDGDDDEPGFDVDDFDAPAYDPLASPAGEWSDGPAAAADDEEYDPTEAKYKNLDGMFGLGDGDDDDYEGEEWKYGLQPGERPPNPAAEEAERQWQREQEMYDEPDQRPRVLDWSDRKDRRDYPTSFGGGSFGTGGFNGPDDQQFDDDDIPF